MDLTKLPDIDEKTWAEVKEYLQSNQEVAKSLQSFASNPEAVRGWLSTKAMVEYYNKKIEDGETGKFDALKDDPEMAPIFKHIEKDGIEAAIKYCTDEELMLKHEANCPQVYRWQGAPQARRLQGNQGRQEGRLWWSQEASPIPTRYRGSP